MGGKGYKETVHSLLSLRQSLSETSCLPQRDEKWLSLDQELCRTPMKHLEAEAGASGVQGQTNGQSGEWGEAEEHGGKVRSQPGGHLGKWRLRSGWSYDPVRVKRPGNVMWLLMWNFPQFKVLGGPFKPAVLNL